VNDIWVCATCKSINRQRERSCYKCRAPQAAAMPAGGVDMRTERAVANRAQRAYLPSWPLAILAGGLLVTVAVLGVILLVLQAQGYPELKAAFAAAFGGNEASLTATMTAQAAGLAGLGLVRSGLVLLALFSFAAWLAVATMNVPALGGGYPSRGPVRVFIYTLIPIWNLFKVPGIVQDVLYRVDPRAGGAMMVLAAAIGLVGSWVLSFLGQWAISASAIGSLVGASTRDEAASIFAGMLDQLFLLAVVTELMIAVGTLLLVVLMGRIERRCLIRDREIKAAAATAA
jgi:hypothetical protein